MLLQRNLAISVLFVVSMFALPAWATGPAPALPRLVDLGAGKCIPCKKMAPIIEELQKDYTGIVEIVFVDVWKNPKAGKPYKIRVIPTQIFYDKTGKEVFRHEGYFSREEIEKVFQEKMAVKPAPKPQKKEEKESSGSLLPTSRAVGEERDSSRLSAEDSL